MTHKLTHDWLQELVLLGDESGTACGIPGAVIACDISFLTGKPPKFQHFAAFGPGTVEPQLWNLFQVSPQLYQKLTGCYAAFEEIAAMFERINISEDNPYLKMIRAEQDSILLVQKCAQEGLQKTADQLTKEMERNRNV